MTLRVPRSVSQREGIGFVRSVNDHSGEFRFSQRLSLRVSRVLNTCLYAGFRADLADSAEAEIP